MKCPFVFALHVTAEETKDNGEEEESPSRKVVCCEIVIF